jgi:nucleoside-diphosphate-sugar epimerase
MNRYRIESKTADIVVKGKAERRWSWIHISDLSAAYTAVVNASHSIIGGQIYNVGDDTRVTYVQARELMARAAGSEGKVVVVAEAGPADASCVLDTQKIRRQLNWRPTRSSFTDNIPLYYQSWLAHQSKSIAATATATAAAAKPSA